MNQDEQHLNLLAIFRWVGGGLTCLASPLGLIYVFMGLAMETGRWDGSDPGPPGMGWMFIIVGALIVLALLAIGGLMIATGFKLRARKSRTFCIVIAAIETLLQPIGTVLGVFTIIVLMRDSVTRLFAGDPLNHSEPPPPSP